MHSGNEPGPSAFMLRSAWTTSSSDIRRATAGIRFLLKEKYGTSGLTSAANAHEGIPGQARARPVFRPFFGWRVPPTTSIQKIGFQLPEDAECHWLTVRQPT